MPRFSIFWPRAARLGLVILLAVILIPSACTKSPIDVELPTEPLELEISVTSGPPGTVARLTGLDPAEHDPGRMQVYFGDRPAPFVVEEAALATVFPLPEGEDVWATPPDQPVAVEVRVDDEVIGLTERVVVITALSPAPGTTGAILEDLEEVAGGLALLLEAMPLQDQYAVAHRAAISGTLLELLSEGENSLAAILAQGGVDVDIVDALLASSGAREYTGRLRALFEPGPGGLFPAGRQGVEGAAGSLFCRGGGEDFDLACKMQIYEILSDFSRYFVAPTVKTWANTVGLAAGAYALSGLRIPYVNIVTSILMVADFVMGSIVPGLYPARIESFELSVDEDVIEVGEMTSSRIEIVAVNDPPPMTVSSILDLAVAALGLRSSSALAESFREVLVSTIQFALDVYNRILQETIDQHGLPPVDAFSGVPDMEWGPVTVESADLVQLFSFDTSVIAGDEEALEWVGVARGSANIQARTRGPGERSRVLTFCPGCEYTGGAFGTGSAATASVRITVGRPGTLDLEIAGLPVGAPADVMVIGPSFSRAVTESVVIEELEPGTYTISALEVTDPADGTAYVPETGVQDVEVTSGETTSAVVQYEPRYGSLFLVISDLPAGVSADVTVSGPGYSRELTETELLEELEAGQYTVTARPVGDGHGNTLIPVPEQQTVTVSGGETATATVRYAPAELRLSTRIAGFGAFRVASHARVWSPGPEEIEEYYLGLDEFIGVCPPAWEVTQEALGPVSAAIDNQSAVSAGSIELSEDGRTLRIQWEGQASSATPAGEFNTSSAHASFSMGGYHTTQSALLFLVDNPGGYQAELEVEWLMNVSESSSGVADTRFYVEGYYELRAACFTEIWDNIRRPDLLSGHAVESWQFTEKRRYLKIWLIHGVRSSGPGREGETGSAQASSNAELVVRLRKVSD